MGRTCLICNKVIYRKFRMHLELNHNLSVREYYDTYLKQEGDGYCKNCGVGVEFVEGLYRYRKFCSQSCVFAYTHKQLKKKDPKGYIAWHKRAGKAFWADPERAERQKKLVSEYQKKHGKLNQVKAEKRKVDPEYDKHLREVAAKNGFGTLSKQPWFTELRRECASKQAISQVLDPNCKWGTRKGKGVTYHGVFLRSSWELSFAKVLDSFEIDWQYEAYVFILGHGKRYIPDFYLPKLDTFVEIRPKGFIDGESEKKLAFVAKCGYRVLFLHEENWDTEIEKIILSTKESPKLLSQLIRFCRHAKSDIINWFRKREVTVRVYGKLLIP